MSSQIEGLGNMLCTVAEVRQEMEERPKTIIIYLKIKLDIKAETINLPDPEKVKLATDQVPFPEL